MHYKEFCLISPILELCTVLYFYSNMDRVNFSAVAEIKDPLIAKVKSTLNFLIRFLFFEF